MKYLLLLVALALTACQLPAGTVSSSLTPSPTVTPAAPPPLDAPTRLVAEVVKSDALLRDGPGEAGRVINKLGTGTLLTVRHPERGGPWYEVTYESAGQSGWIHGSLIRFRSGTPATLVSTPTPTPKPTPAPTPIPSPTLDLSGIAEDDPAEEEDSSDSVKVWVNTNSGVYHCPGTRWYGNTKEGEYMTQAQAVAEGHRPAYHRRCN